MDHYQFPHITHISQCLQAIEGCENFIVAERDDHTIINYMMMDTATFPRVHEEGEWTKAARPPEGWKPMTAYNIDAAIRRECRGIVFGPDGRVIARRLHKFFNVGERPEVELQGVDLSRLHVILDKLDGSMITPIPIRGHVRWGTKMGLTSVGFQAEEFVSTRPEYLDFAVHCVHAGITPIFEWCSRKQRIVVDYPRDTLVLVAVRDNVTGVYLPYEHMITFGLFWKLPVVGYLNEDFERDCGNKLESMVEVIRDLGSDVEGYVVRFEDGHMIKIKSDDYVRIHRAKDTIMQEKRVIEMIVNEKVDDVLPHLIDHDRKALEEFRDEFWSGLLDMKNEIAHLYTRWYEATKRDKKEFAIHADMDPVRKSVIFSVWGCLPVQASGRVFDELKKRVQKNLGSGTKVEGARWIWGGARWADHIHAQEEEAA
jgi:RNA ligase